MNMFTESIDLNNCILIQTGDINLNDIQYKVPEETEVIRIISDDSKNTVFTCQFCNKTFSKWITFKKHETNHKKEKKFKCDECLASFNIITNLTLHKAIHNKNETKCPECNKVFTRVASLRAHLILHEKDESISCPECQKLFDTELQLESHMKSHGKKKNPTEDNLRCKLCNRDFTNATEHKIHMHNHNKMKHLLVGLPHKSTNGKNRKARTRYAHACNDCPKTFQKRSQLVRHMRVHNGEKPFQCQLCNHAFSQNNTLKIHMSKHTGIKPFKCSLCPGTFSQKGNLRVHIHRVHSIPREENAFHCTECACAFRRLSALNAHINRVHGDTPTNFDPSKGYPPNITISNSSFSNVVHESGSSDKSSQDGCKYITLADTDMEGIMKRYYIRQRKIEGVRWLRCTYCIKEFKKPSDVVRHIRTHTREKPFQCPKCGRGFAVKSTLTTHMRTHTNEKIYNCALCDKSFSSSNSLQAHFRRHTGIKKSYRCKSCSNTYNTPEQLKIHSMIHAREEQKKENIEPNTLLPQIQLKDPIFITNRGSRLYCTPTKTKFLKSSKVFRAHTCQTCGSSFRKSGQLKQHLRMHSNDRPYSCPKCERTFKSSTVLNTHIKTHDAIKRFHCTECESAFTTKGSLRRHMIKHSSQRPYMCPYCKKMFKTLQNCKKHIKSHRSDICLNASEERQRLQQGPLVSVLKNTNLNFGENSILDNLPFDKNTQTNSISNIIVYDPVANIHDLIQNNNTNGQLICQLLTTDNTFSLNNVLNEPNSQQNIIQFNDSPKHEQIELINQEDKCPNITVTKELLTSLDASTKHIQLPVFHQEFDPKFYTQQISLVSNSVNDNVDNFEIVDQDIPNIFYSHNAVDVQNNDCIFINTDEATENVSNLNTLPSIYTLEKTENNSRIAKKSNRRLRILKQRSKPKVAVEETIDKDQNHNESDSKINLIKNEFINNSENNEYFINTSNNNNNNIKKYICSTCLKGFRKPSDLERHIRTHTGERPFRCEKCGKSFSLKSTLKSHTKIHSSVLKKFTCPQCDCLFSTKGSLKVHIRIHTGSKPFQCPYCPMRFRTSGHRQTHCQVHLKEAERSNSTSSNIKKTKKSIKAKMDDKPNFETDEIDNLTSVENIRPIQPEENSNICYTLPDNQASNAINLDMLSTFPETILENIQQPEQDTSILEQLESGGLLIHDVFNNTDQSWYDVEMYESGQIINVHLASNSKTGSEDIPNELEAAIPCSVEFIQESNNPIQIEQENNDVLESSRNNQNICSYCKKTFEKPSKLERHLRVHTGDRPFICAICKKAFTQMNSLNAHMRTHSGNKPYKCLYCDHSTAQKGNLNIHLMKIHGVSGNQFGVLKTPILEEIEQKLNEHIQ